MNAIERWTVFFTKTGEERVIETNSQIVGLRKLIKRTGRNKNATSEYQRRDLFDLVNRVCSKANVISPIRVAPELSDKGFDWISATLNRLKGKKDKSDDEDRFVRQVPRILSDGPCEFRFRGLCETSTALDNRYGIIETLPLWQVVNKTGEHFTYGYASWQGGQGLVFLME
jgi:hypothetical protein